MAVLKHIASKNADYTAAERYLTFQHNEQTGKPILDADGYMILRENYLLEGINCNPDTFAGECKKINRQYRKNKNKNEIKTHHYILSFDPKDRELGLAVAQAQELGKEFAMKHFPGHQMLVCTHDDGHNESGNIHVHIVLNSVRMLDTEPLSYEMRACDTRAGYKHNCTKPFLSYLQKEVMQMCREQGLNQVDLFGSQNRVTNAEYRANQRGQMEIENGNAEIKTKFQTDKEMIRQAILAAIEQSADLEEFKKKLFASSGIEVKESRGRFSYIQSGKKREITGKKLGDAYTKEAVEAAIFGEHNLTFAHDEQKLEQPGNLLLIGTESIGRVVDIEHNGKVQNSAGYAHWAKLHNLKEQAKTFTYLVENGLLDSDMLDKESEVLSHAYQQAKSELKSTEAALKLVNRKLRLLGQYYSTKQCYHTYCSGRKQSKYYDAHRSEIDLHEAAAKELRQIVGEEKLPLVKSLKEEKAILSAQKEKQYQEYQVIRSRWSELKKIIQNRNSLLTRENAPQNEKNPTGLG